MSDHKGFTLVEIIAVLVILSVLSAIVVPRFINLDVNAKIRGLEYGVAELNGRESLSWANIKLSDSGWINDAQVWSILNTDLGEDYSWDVTPTETGGTLEFKESTQSLTRNLSTFSDPAFWN